MSLSGRILSDYRGLGVQAGGLVSGEAHLVQSIRNVLSTPIGSRVMRREYGSRLPELIDAPAGPGLVADAVAAVAEALQRWEPRIRVKRVLVGAIGAGRLSLDLVVETGGRSVKLEGVF